MDVRMESLMVGYLEHEWAVRKAVKKEQHLAECSGPQSVETKGCCWVVLSVESMGWRWAER